METFEQRVSTLVHDDGSETAVAAIAVLPHSLDDEARPDRVAHDRRLQKPASLLDEHEAFEAFARDRGAERRHPGKQQTVRERFAELSLARVFDVVMDRMNIAGEPREQQEVRVVEGLGRTLEFLADLQRGRSHRRRDRINWSATLSAEEGGPLGRYHLGILWK